MEVLGILLLNALVCYLCVGVFVSCLIACCQIIFPDHLDFNFVDYLLFVPLWASVLQSLILKQNNQR